VSTRSSLVLWALLPLLVAADAREVASREGANVQRPRWSNDGKSLAYEANFHDEKRIELYVGDPSGGRFTRVTPTSRGASISEGFGRTTTGEVAHEIAWSPASIGRFVYSASNDARDYDLYMGGGGPLTSEMGADDGAQWSPDGRFIAFTSGRTGEGDLYLLDLGAITAPPRRLTEMSDSSETFVTWSPDSTKLAFVGHSNRGDNLWLIPGLGDPAIRLTDWTGNQTRPTFSPRGTWIAFYANLEQEDRMDLYIVEPREGAAPRLVIRNVVPNASGPSWMPDGEHMIVVLDDDDRYDPIVKVEARPGAIAVPVETGTVGNGDIDVVRAKDGRVLLAFVAQGKTGDPVRDYKRLFVTELATTP